MRPRNWVVLGGVLAACGYFLAAVLLLGSPANFLAWSALAVGLLVAASGLRALPKVGVLPVLGFLVAALVSGFELVSGWVAHPSDLILSISNAAALLGMAVAAWVSLRAWREPAAKPEDLRGLALGFLLGALAGAGYFVLDAIAARTQFLVGDVLVLIGMSVAAWKIRAVSQSS